jgi:hypothetical protein
MSLPSRVVVLSTDLLDRSRFDPLRGLGVEVQLVRRAADVAAALGEPAVGDAGVTVVVVDLARPDALEAIAQSVTAGTDVVAYGSHVERATLDDAHAAGARVLARSAFFGRLPDVLG